MNNQKHFQADFMNVRLTYCKVLLNQYSLLAEPCFRSARAVTLSGVEGSAREMVNFGSSILSLFDTSQFDASKSKTSR
jgi:hypothetical protein